jgi:formate--tetrahydrofolate ligase
MASDIEIARTAKLQPITAIADRLGLPDTALHPYGRVIAKVDLDHLASLPERPNAKLILVTAINPTPAGEGKTTTTVGLGDALNHIGKQAMVCLREPSLGPCFGIKGGAAGGGQAQIVPMEQINLHFTGDFHAITSAHNLLAALVDNHLHWGNASGLDPRHISWKRVLDMNDRSLRHTIIGTGRRNGPVREDGFDITVASEVMAVFCLATSLADLEARLGAMAVGQRADRSLVTAADLKAHGAMTVLLKDALAPNLVQTIAGTPAFVHGGPFANIAHGCNSVIATTAGLKLADYVVTEAGFGADLGAEKFLNIKCRKAGLKPDAVVVVATVRALKMHGGVAVSELGHENLAALEAGLVNLDRHLENLARFGLTPVVALNAFTTDTPAEQALVIEHCRTHHGVAAHVCRHWADGGPGAAELARSVVAIAEGPHPKPFQFLYPDAMPLADKIETIARTLYRAGGVSFTGAVRKHLAEFEAAGFGELPVCIAKTQYSFSSDPALRGAPTGHALPVRDVRLSAGAGFVVAVCGDIMTMPGLPRIPSAERIGLNAQGEVDGLF